ncbi:MAG: hypothetical protein AAGD06_11685 [Acidobacteriota bacterium]
MRFISYPPSSTIALVAFVVVSLVSPAAFAASSPCNPCAGIVVDDPVSAAAALGVGPKLEGDARFYVAWPETLDSEASSAGYSEVRAAGGTPWIQLTFRSPAPILEHLASLELELQALATVARDAGEGAFLQIDWRPEPGSSTPKDFSYLLKRAAVVITGASTGAKVMVGPLAADADLLRALYAEDVAAYVDGIALAPAEDDAVTAAVAALRELDPGKPLVMDRLPWPEDAGLTLARTAAGAELGLGITLFDYPAAGGDLGPLKLLAREFQGDLSFDPYSVPRGAEKAWTFVKGDDLSLRIIAQAPAGAAQLPLFFDDPQLRAPRVYSFDDGSESSVFGQSRTQGGLFVPVEEPGRVSVLKLERMSVAELEGLEAEVQVQDARQMPVEEVLRRLQASEDDQARRLERYQARNILHLRFQIAGTGGIEASFAGDFFFRQDEGFDWVWQDFYFNGVKWKDDRLPELPLVSPEKAAVFPLEINFTKEYTYRLRGTETVEGRDCWVVDFEPTAAPPAGETLYQGTVWVDRELYVRVKSRTLQLGLQGEVLSNDETIYQTPVGADGQPAPWARSSYFLPTRIVGQQVFSLLNSPVQVEREALLSDLRLNPTDFDDRLAEAYASEATMVRDTQEGLRYLVKDESGERVVEEERDTTRLLLVGGVFYDDGQDFPLPLAGINYLDLDFMDKGGQLNVLFAGAFLQANLAQPRLFGEASKWDAGAAVNGFFIKLGDELYRDGREVQSEEVERRQFGASLFLGRFIGNYLTVDFSYRLRALDWDTADDTDEAFILPQDTTEHRFQTELTYARAGYRFRAAGSFNQRSDWEFWGLPDNTDFDQEQEDYLRYEVSLAKTWWLPKFTKIALEVEHLGGEDLDRFSKYDFGIFGDADVAGYQNGLVRAEEANGVHLSYGFDLGELFQIELEGDAVWASDEATGLEDELLAGIGVEGTVMGPWRTILNFEVGVPVEGPGEGFAARLVFLKLFG